MSRHFSLVAGVLGLALLCANVRAEDAKATPEVAEGFIHTVDAGTTSFVLGGKNESQTTFKVMVKPDGKKEAAHILLDGKRTSFETAIQPKRKASVTYVKVAKDDLWVWKVDVTSAAK
ncbi:MAG TPA: hypothetical protein VM512_01645 [Burkholderiaceae bacterium]|nr:hypothetical protein [Burkholderiaceae bacterium]